MQEETLRIQHHRFVDLARPQHSLAGVDRRSLIGGAAAAAHQRRARQGVRGGPYLRCELARTGRTDLQSRHGTLRERPRLGQLAHGPPALIAQDPHPLAKFRANGPLSNMPEFAEAFQCKTGSPMVRAKRCQIW